MKDSLETQFMTFAENNVDNNFALVESIYQSIDSERELMIHETKNRLTHLTQTVLSILNYYNDLVIQRKMSLAQAQSMAKETINNLRYGEGGYFWVDNTDYILQVLPSNPSAVGMNRENLTDVNGKRMVKEMVDGAVSKGSVFVEYWFPKLANQAPYPKLSYAALFEPWNWVVGTGEYIDNIDSAMEELEKVQLQKLNELMYIRSYYNSYGFIKDRDGRYIAYVDQKKVGQISDSKDVRTGASLNKLYFDTKNGPVEYYYTKNGEGEYKKIGFVRYHETRGYTIVYTIYEDELMKQVNKIRFVLILVGIFSFFFLGSSSFLLLRRISKPILKTTEILQDISEGDGDLTQRIELKTDDEIGLMAKHFNTFMGNLSQIIIDLRNISSNNKEIGENLAANTTEISSSTVEMAATMRSLNEKTDLLTDRIESSTEKVEDIKEQINNVNENIDSETAFINESSAAITEMVASIQNLSRISQEKSVLIKELSDHSYKSGTIMEETAREIIDISNSVDTIQELVVVINGVSDQINLLSMNAAIEAAHAGEAGRGFAVVAEEIRKLADTTNEQSDRITQSVHDIAQRINESGQKSQSTVESISYINTNIQQIADTMNELVQGMTEISEGSRQIIESLEELVNSSTIVRESANRVNENSDVVLSSMEEIRSISNQNLQGIKEITLAADQISSVIQELADMGNKNNDNIHLMDKSVNRFKTE